MGMWQTRVNGWQLSCPNTPQDEPCWRHFASKMIFLKILLFLGIPNLRFKHLLEHLVVLMAFDIFAFFCAKCITLSKKFFAPGSGPEDNDDEKSQRRWRRTDGRTVRNERTNGPTDGQTDGRTHEQSSTDEWTKEKDTLNQIRNVTHFSFFNVQHSVRLGWW